MTVMMGDRDHEVKRKSLERWGKDIRHKCGRATQQHATHLARVHEALLWDVLQAAGSCVVASGLVDVSKLQHTNIS